MSAVATELSLVCRARTVLCATPVTHLAETMRPLPVRSLPAAPPFVLGVSRIRGLIVPVVDLGALLGAAEPAGATRFVIVKAGERRVAMAVEAVVGLRTIPSDSLAELPALLGAARHGAAAALGALDAELLVLLGSSRLVPESVWRGLVDES